MEDETGGETSTVVVAAAAATATATVATIFEDTSTDCAICLDSLLEDSGRRVITLPTCGHKWHYDCIVQQLQTAQPTTKQRLLFTGCQCAKCGSICDHPDLRDLTRTTDVLRERVDRLLEEQLALDAPDLWRQHQVGDDGLSSSRKALLDHARRKYAFYLCSHCREPYFGGTVECADQAVLVEGEEQLEERLCVACAPQSQVTCRNPLEHRGHLVWKCRYCCRPSTHLCYGNVHFCDDCHARNSQRVRQSQLQLQGQSSRNRRSAVRPPPLSPIPCPGDDCPYPKPSAEDEGGSSSSRRKSHHSNGPTSKSEQVYGCAWCQSTSNVEASIVEEPGSANLLFNPSGQFQLQGWHQRNPRMSWTVETSEHPVNATTLTNFVSSYAPCVMEQVLDLSTIFTTIPTDGSSSLTLEVSARYMGRTDCPSIFCLKAELFDAQRRPIPPQEQQATTATPVLEAPPDHWERARLTIPLVAAVHDTNARYLSVVVVGKDLRFWQGRFGSKVTELSVRLLGPPEQVTAILRPEYFPQAQDTTTTTAPPPPTVTRNRATAATRRDSAVDRHRELEGRGGCDVEPHPRRQLSPTLVVLRDGLLPLVCLLALAWLLR